MYMYNFSSKTDRLTVFVAELDEAELGCVLYMYLCISLHIRRCIYIYALPYSYIYITATVTQIRPCGPFLVRAVPIERERERARERDGLTYRVNPIDT